jgi:hypothetical protein
VDTRCWGGMDARRDKPGREDQSIDFIDKALPAQSTGGEKLRRSRSVAELGGSVSQTCSAGWTRSKGCRDSREVQDTPKSPDIDKENIAKLPASLPD